jgi:hypothetical protein
MSSISASLAISLLIWLHISQAHCTKNQIYVFPEMKLHGASFLIPTFMSVSYLCIPSLSICLQQNRQTDPENISLHDTCMIQADTLMWKLGDRTLYFCFWKNEASHFHFQEYMNRNQTLILDSHWPFICSMFPPLLYVLQMVCLTFSVSIRSYSSVADLLVHWIHKIIRSRQESKCYH